ncbi:hypothetical protein J6590_065383 [Homalodisca vitripennis]|nr:hypothetical protein J6590_065383 [Homalodisca vitripennis]
MGSSKSIRRLNTGRAISHEPRPAHAHEPPLRYTLATDPTKCNEVIFVVHGLEQTVLGLAAMGYTICGSREPFHCSLATIHVGVDSYYI